jgi:5-formyltetrahydrofolate cyclo-ligase
MPTSEVQTDPIVRHALQSGKQVFVPYLHKNDGGVKGSADGEHAPKRIMDMVALRDVADYEGLERDSWGIPTVGDGAVGRVRVLGDGVDGEDRVGLDLVLMPGVLFEMQRDGKVRRLGHGKGFYDFFLYRYQKAYGSVSAVESWSKLQLYGLALEEQFLLEGGEDMVPVGDHDHLLDGVVLGVATP